MIKNHSEVVKQARELRSKGWSHRQIASSLSISLGSANLFTQGIKLTWDQHVKLMRNSGIFQHSHEERSKWSSRGSKNWLAKIKYFEPDLIKKIQDFYTFHQRIPVKREFVSIYHAYIRVFGSWNKAILAAGFTPNEVIFSKKFVANDGHVCDSYSEKIIDDWLNENGINHLVHVPYPGQTKFKCDFLIKGKFWIEFLGLLGVASYRKLYIKKKELALSQKISILELFPKDLFPENKLSKRIMIEN